MPFELGVSSTSGNWARSAAGSRRATRRPATRLVISIWMALAAGELESDTDWPRTGGALDREADGADLVLDGGRRIGVDAARVSATRTSAAITIQLQRRKRGPRSRRRVLVALDQVVELGGRDPPLEALTTTPVGLTRNDSGTRATP